MPGGLAGVEWVEEREAVVLLRRKRGKEKK
jgi:hypothetical protein